MKTAGWLEPEDMPLWDRFVKGHPLGGLYQTTLWQRVLERSFSHICGQVCAIRNSRTGEILAGISVYTVKSWLLGSRLVSVPFATLCDPLISSAGDLDMLMPLVQKLYRQSSGKYVEIRTLKATSLIQTPHLRASHSYVHQFVRLGRPLEEIEKGFSRIVRRSVKQSLDEGINVRPGLTKRDLLEFHRLLVKTRQRLALPPIPFLFFDSIWTELRQADRLSLLMAECGGVTVGGLLSIKSRGTYALEYIAGTGSDRGKGVMYLLYREALKEACTSGFKLLSFGRTYRGNSGLLKFKEHWGTESEDLCTFFYPETTHKDAEDRDASWQYSLSRFLVRNMPAAASRILGDFCYRHMG